MNSIYMIYCCAGTGGLFLSTVIAQLLGANVAATFSISGHAHNMGRGNWRGADSVCFIGNYWDINYRPGYRLYYSHVMPKNYIQLNPDIKIIKIDTDSVDYRKVTELYVCKAWPDLWTQEEYAKWASPSYPPYSRTNIQDSELVRNDLINDLVVTNIQPWHEQNASIPVYASINFRTIMGIDQRDLVSDVCNILQCTADNSTVQYVQEYQQLNKHLYFNNYV